MYMVYTIIASRKLRVSIVDGVFSYAINFQTVVLWILVCLSGFHSDNHTKRTILNTNKFT